MEEIEDRVQLAEIKKDVGYIRGEITKINILLAEKYVTVGEFTPVKNIVFGMVGFILIAVMGTLLTVVIK